MTMVLLVSYPTPRPVRLQRFNRYRMFRSSRAHRIWLCKRSWQQTTLLDVAIAWPLPECCTHLSYTT